MALTDKLTAIADAIRAKTGKTDSLTLEQMPGEIAGITGGGGGSSADVRYVTFVNDSTGESFVKPVAYGDDCVDVVAKGLWKTPTQESTAQYNYTFYGWGAEPGGAADANILKNITEDKTVYAIFTATLRTYTITYYDEDGTTVLNTEKLAYGSVPSYTPYKPDLVFDGWIPTPKKVTGDASYKAVWITKPASVTATGSCGTDVTYTLYDNGTLKISGSGAVSDYSISPADKQSPFTKNYATQIKSIVIEDGVTSIGNFVFYNCASAESLVLSDSVKTFTSYSFYSTELKSVYVGAGLETGLGGQKGLLNGSTITSCEISSDNAVYAMVGPLLCDKAETNILNCLKNVEGEFVIPDGFESIGSWAFNFCKSLTSVTIPDSVTSIGARAFRSCTQLVSVAIGGGVTTIGADMAEGCTALTSVSFEVTAGWSAGSTALSASDLANPETAATYLKNTYNSSSWTRT